MKAKSAFLVCAAFVLSLFAAFIQPKSLYAQELATPITIVNVSFLNLRTGPGPEYSIITQVVGGSTFPVIGVNSDSSWLLVDTPAGAGWVYAEFTLPRGDFRFVPLLSAPPAGGTLSLTTPLYIGLGDVNALTAAQANTIELPVPVLQAPTIIVNTSFLNVRSGPAGYFDVIAVTSGGDRFTPLGITNDGEWFLIESTFGRGWVDSEFVLFRGIIDNVPIIFAY